MSASLIICDKCGYKFGPEKIKIRVRAIDKSEKVYKQFFKCPKCKGEYTILITDPEIVRLIAAGKREEAGIHETELRERYLKD